MQAAPPVVTKDWRSIFGDETVFLLAAHPGDETRLFGGFIARACAAGRPPFVAVLTDGAAGSGQGSDDLAMRRERQARAATARIGLDSDRLLFLGLAQGSVVAHGPFADAVVAAIDLLMWRNDCHVLCAAAEGDADSLAAADLARAVVRRTGLRLMLRTGGAGSRLDTTRTLPALRRARAELALPDILDTTTAEAYAPA